MDHRGPRTCVVVRCDRAPRFACVCAPLLERAVQSGAVCVEGVTFDTGGLPLEMLVSCRATLASCHSRWCLGTSPFGTGQHSFAPDRSHPIVRTRSFAPEEGKVQAAPAFAGGGAPAVASVSVSFTFWSYRLSLASRFVVHFLVVSRWHPLPVRVPKCLLARR